MDSDSIIYSNDDEAKEDFYLPIKKKHEIKCEIKQENYKCEIK